MSHEKSSMLRLVIAAEAEQHLISIGEYSYQQWGLAQRNKYIKNLTDRFRWLTKNPTLGKDRKDIRPGCHSFCEGKHIVFYTDTDTTLNVIAVLHEQMDYVRHL